MSKLNHLIIEMDWTLLRSQKEGLIDIRCTFPEESKEYGILSAVIHMIDHVQDSAVESGLKERMVFGKLQE